MLPASERNQNQISLARLLQLLGLAGIIGLLLLVTAEDLNLRGFASENSEAPTPAPTYQTIDLAGVLRAAKSSENVIVDARPSFLYQNGHIQSAINVPVASVAELAPELVARLKKARQVVIYCEGTWCGLAGHEVELLEPLGITNTVVYSGGWAEWSSCALPGTPAGL